MVVRVANGAGFWGDQIDAPRRLVEATEVDYLTLEYLAELTLSILAQQRRKDSTLGYARDFLTVLESLTPALTRQPQLKIVTNAGGIHPHACAAAAAQILKVAGLGDLPVAVVKGDDLVAQWDELADTQWPHLETGAPLPAAREQVLCAHAYLGAEPLVAALQDGARVVITGRGADAALCLAPAVATYGWSWNDWDRLAGASVAGHLIECGAQVTGGYSEAWRDTDLSDVGYPIAEIAEDGEAVITKPPGTGGLVNRSTVIQQLLYEIGDPRAYLTPDVSVDFTSVEVDSCGADRVRVWGARGNPPPDTFKVSLSYQDGFAASGQLLVHGSDVEARAHAAAEIVWKRLERARQLPQRRCVELLGDGRASGATALASSASPVGEVALRLTVQDESRDTVARFVKELAPLITSGPAGLAGYAAPRSPIRPVLAFWPCTIDRQRVEPVVEVRAAADWSAG